MKRLNVVLVNFFLILQETQVAELVRRHEDLVHQHKLDKDEMHSRFTAQIEELRLEIENMQRDHDEQLVVAESDKQQVFRWYSYHEEQFLWFVIN